METKEILWLDQKIFNSQNKKYISNLEKDNFKILPYNNIKNLMEKMESITFKMYIVIVSGRLFPEYVTKIKNNKKLFIIPLTLIFTFNKTGLKQEINKDYLEFLNHKYFNPLGIVDEFKDLRNILKETISKLEKIISHIQLGNTPKPYNYKECMAFEYLEDNNQLIFPYLYQKIMSNSKVDSNSIEIFNKFLLENFGKDEEIKELTQIFFLCKDIPEQLVAKYWGKIYTLETPFYYNINWDLMNLKNQNYNTFIQTFYSGFKECNYDFEKEEKKTLNRGTNINNKEVQKILDYKKKYLNGQSNDNNLQIRILVYSRAFLSFSTNIEKAKTFMKNINGTEKVLFELKNDIKSEIISNADFRKINKYNENEILFFPFSSFIITDILPINDYYIIYLNYLGMYEEVIKQNIEKIKDKPELIEEISQNTNLSKDVFASEIMINKNIEKNFEETPETKEKDSLNYLERKISSVFITMNKEEIKEKEEIKKEEKEEELKSTIEKEENKIENNIIKYCLCKENKAFIPNLKKIFNMNILEYVSLKDIFNSIQKISQNNTLLILTERLFLSYIDEIKIIKDSGCIPYTLILGSKLLKQNKEYSQHLKNKNYKIMGIAETYKELKQKIMYTINYLEIKEKNYQFVYIDNKNKEFLPPLYEDIINNNIPDKDSINSFNKYLIEKYGENTEIKKLIEPLLKKDTIDISSIAKIYGRIYTMETPFYIDLRKKLLELDFYTYEIFIKILYFGLKKYAYDENKIIYKGSIIKKEEIKQMEDILKNKFPNIIYSVSYLSFNEKEEMAMKFASRQKLDYISVLFKIKYDNNNIRNKSNAFTKDFSAYPEEKEILFFPFSAFTLEDITEGWNKNNQKIYIITLNYLGIYYKIEKTEKKEKNNNQDDEEISVIIISSNQIFKYPFICKKSDKFKVLQQKFYEKNPELKNKSCYFLHNGMLINVENTIDENKIKDGEIIVYNQIEEDE